MRLNQVKEKYDSLAHYYDKRWEGYLEATHKVAIELLKPKADDTILDASGGTGLLSEKLIPTLGNRGQIFLIDISDTMTAIAKDRLEQFDNIMISRQDVNKLDFPENFFSKILCVNAFHYYSNPHQVLTNFYRILKPDGRLIIVDWCRDSFHFKAYNFLLKYLSKSHVKIYTSKEFKDLLDNAKFILEELTPFSYGLWRLTGLGARKV